MPGYDETMKELFGSNQVDMRHGEVWLDATGVPHLVLGEETVSVKLSVSFGETSQEFSLEGYDMLDLETGERITKLKFLGFPGWVRHEP